MVSVDETNVIHAKMFLDGLQIKRTIWTELNIYSRHSMSTQTPAQVWRKTNVDQADTCKDIELVFSNYIKELTFYLQGD